MLEDLDVALTIFVVDILVLVVERDEGLHVAGVPFIDLLLCWCGQVG